MWAHSTVFYATETGCFRKPRTKQMQYLLNWNTFIIKKKHWQAVQLQKGLCEHLGEFCIMHEASYDL